MPTCKMIDIAACDDNREELAGIVSMTEQLLDEMSIPHRITTYDDGEYLLADVRNGAQFHVYLLDVVMDSLDGLQLAAELRRLDSKAQIVFISNSREMAMYGYEVSAARFLAKPVEMHKLKEALLFCFRSVQAKKEILLPTNKGMHRISLSDIQYAEAFDRGTRVVLRDEVFEIRMKFSEIDALLPHSVFLLCHRAYIINLSAVKLIRPYEFVLKTGLCVPIGKGRYPEIKSQFMSYITD